MVDLTFCVSASGTPLAMRPSTMAVPGIAIRRIGAELFDEIFRRLANFEAHRVHDLLALAPGEHEERDDEGDQQREPAALEQLGRGGGKEQQIERRAELPLTASTSKDCTFQCSATKVAINVVIAISIDTAMPKAPASASEEPKPITAVSVAAASAQLTNGM